MGRKNRDNRIGRPGESLEEKEASSETGSGAKTQGRGSAKGLARGISCCFAGEFNEGNKVRRGYNARISVNERSTQRSSTESRSGRRRAGLLHHIFMPECSGIF